jgi:hypothetical protein
MPDATVGADARTLPENPDAELVSMMKKLKETYAAFEALPTPGSGELDDELCAKVDEW